MDSTLGSAIIGGAVTLAVFVAGGVAGAAKDRAAGRDAAKKEARAAIEDLLRAALDLQITLAVLDVRRRDWQTMCTVMPGPSRNSLPAIRKVIRSEARPRDSTRQ